MTPAEHRARPWTTEGARLAVLEGLTDLELAALLGASFYLTHATRVAAEAEAARRRELAGR